MPIRPKLDELLYQRRMTLTELSERTGVALQNLSILKTGKARAVRFSTLEAICGVLDCQPGDVLEFVTGAEPERASKGGEAMKKLAGAAAAEAAKRVAVFLLLAPLLLAVLASTSLAAETQERIGCAAARAAVPDLTSCVETPRGLVLAPSDGEAAQLARHAAAGEERFETHFGMAPPPYALLTSTGSEKAKALRALGFKAVLPWASRAEMEASLVQALRQSAEAGARSQKLPEAQVAAAGEQAVSAMRGPVVAGWEARQSGLVPHELGHVWLLGAFWPDERHVEGRRYGSAGPDWLDEVAAILMEDERLTKERRDQFAQAYRGEPASQRLRQIGRDDLLDLPKFLGREHPSIGSKPPGGSGAPPPGGNRISVTVSRDGSGSELTMFYLQTRLFADYLIARSGRSDIFAGISRAIAEGQSFERWLTDAGERHGLPRNTALLAADWRKWLETSLASDGA